MTDPSTSSPLDVFTSAQHHEGGSRSRRLILLAVSVFSVVALLALATNDRSPDGLAILNPDQGGIEGSSPGVSEGSNSAPGDNGLGSGTSATGGVAGSGSAVSGGDASGGAGETSDDPFTSPPAAQAETDIVVASGVLKIFSFGSQVGLPLLCNVAVGSLISGVSDPALAEVVGTIASSCVQFGNEGAAALTALNQQLAGLAAINPAVAPLIVTVADSFNAAGGADVPFANALLSIAGLVRFFTGTA